jgi:hypothetical protein
MVISQAGTRPCLPNEKEEQKGTRPTRVASLTSASPAFVGCRARRSLLCLGRASSPPAGGLKVETATDRVGGRSEFERGGF